MKFFFKNDHMGPLFLIFLIFQLYSGGVINLFSYTKLLVVTCRRVVNYVIADSHSWWGNGFFLEKMLKLWFLNILKLSLFPVFNLSVCFSAGMEVVSNVCLQPILPSPGNNSISTKWALYPWNATFLLEFNGVFII